MTLTHEDVFGQLQLIETFDGISLWEGTVNTGEGELLLSFHLPESAIPTSEVLALLLAFAREPERYLTRARQAILDHFRAVPEQYFSDQEAEEVERLLGLAPEVFMAQLRPVAVTLPDEGLALGFETDLDVEHGVGVRFENGEAVEVAEWPAFV